MGDTEQSSWADIIGAVKSPLNLMALIVLTPVILVSSLVAVFQGPLWIPMITLMFCVTVVAVMFIFAKDLFVQKKDRCSLRVNLEFPEEVANEIDLNEQKCRMKILDGKSKETYNGVANVSWSEQSGKWSAIVIEEVEELGSVKLKLEETNGKSWKVRRFSPFISDKKAREMAEGEEW